MSEKVVTKLVYGLGFNSGEYPSRNGRKMTKEYDLWTNMLRRCTEKCWVKRPSYLGTTCSENFKSYSFFYQWCRRQIGFGSVDKNGMYWPLDKDLLVKGNKVYSEDTCCFVPVRINSLLTSCASARGSSFIGTSLYKLNGRYKAKCLDDGKQVFLGYHTKEIDAFNAYKNYKETLIKRVANEYKEVLDGRVYQALLNYTVEITD